MGLISDSAEIETKILSLVKESGLNPYSKTHNSSSQTVYNHNFAKLLTGVISYMKEINESINYDHTFLCLSPKQADDKIRECLNQIKLVKRFLKDLYESNTFTISLQYKHDKLIDIDFFESFFDENSTEEDFYNLDKTFYQIRLLLNSVANLTAMASENKWKAMNDGLVGTHEFHLAVACLRFLKASGSSVSGKSLCDFTGRVISELEEPLPSNESAGGRGTPSEEKDPDQPIEHACRLALEWWKATQEPGGGGPSNRPTDADDIWWRTQFPAPLPANRPARKKPSKKSTPS